MRCIFCKSSENPFTSVEHIVPQSIGNIEHILPKGIVCDICNNYFSRKVENKFINSEAILDIRAKLQIANKRGRIPAEITNSSFSVPEQRIVARFLGKVAIEVLTHRALSWNVPNWQADIIDNKGLDLIRTFARFDTPKEEWPFVFRVLHPVNATFSDGKELMKFYMNLTCFI